MIAVYVVLFYIAIGESLVLMDYLVALQGVTFRRDSQEGVYMEYTYVYAVVGSMADADRMQRYDITSLLHDVLADSPPVLGKAAHRWVRISSEKFLGKEYPQKV